MNNTKQIAAVLKCTPAQVTAQFARNVAQLRAMAAQAAKRNGKVSGFTAVELRAMADKHTP